MLSPEIEYTVIIFLARNGRIRAVKFRPKNFGRISFDLGEIFPNQEILRLNNRRISPEILRANLNCADSPGSPEKIFTLCMDPSFEYLVLFDAKSHMPIQNILSGHRVFVQHSKFPVTRLRK
jgi:hypothetical protein